jgi:hypothetical protein
LLIDDLRKVYPFLGNNIHFKESETQFIFKTFHFFAQFSEFSKDLIFESWNFSFQHDIVISFSIIDFYPGKFHILFANNILDESGEDCPSDPPRFASWKEYKLKL